MAIILYFDDVIFLLMILVVESEWLLRACGHWSLSSVITVSRVECPELVRQDGNCLDTKHCSGN